MLVLKPLLLVATVALLICTAKWYKCCYKLPHSQCQSCSWQLATSFHLLLDPMLASGLGGVDTLPFRAKIAQFAPCLLLHLPTSTPGQCLRANTFLCFSLQHWSNLCSFTEVQNCYFGFYWQLLPFRRESLSPLNWFYYFSFIRPRLPVSTFICTLLGVFTPL